MDRLPDALAPLARFEQFLLYQIIDTGGRARKMPIDPRTLRPYPKGKDWQSDPAATVSAADALGLAAALGDGYGVGFLFTERDPFFFVDVDDCVVDGAWTPAATYLCRLFAGAAVEISQSGEGLHIIGSGVCPPHGCDNKPLHTQFYTDRRFVALTGIAATGSADFDCSAILPGFVAEHFAPGAGGGAVAADWTDEPCPEWSGPADDDALIKKMLASKPAAGAAFGGRATLQQLWEGSTDGHGGDASSADAALAQHLAWWTGKDCERIQRLMRQSGLARDKWEREDYLPRTILKAVALQETVYCDKPTPVRPSAPMQCTAAVPQFVTGYQYLGPTQQAELFAGCVYVQQQHKILLPNGDMLKPEQFNATFGGYVYQLDDGGQKTTRKAWEAFTESQCVRFPRAKGLVFRPELPAGQMMEIDGRPMINAYVPVETRAIDGDPGPFLEHVAKLLPVQRDRDIMLAYMAACVQHKGVKFQWAPLLQGCEGNGKTLLTRAVAFAIGDRYTHLPPANEISEKFNDWLFNRLLIGVEDVFVPDHKREVIEILKPMITNDRLAMRAMQQGQVMGDNRANFILNSNHKDGIRKTLSDRRFAVFYTPQQCAADLQRDGMGGDYFPKLYGWLRADGYAIVNRYLQTYPIPDALNPAGESHRAPETSSTAEAVRAGMGGVEQEILEAVDEERPGFAGGWISSVAVDGLLQAMGSRRTVPPNKRRELLQGLGYDWHPALPGGRVNNPIPIDGGKKPRLFIREGHIHRNLTVPAEVVRHYQDAQGDLSTATPESKFKGGKHAAMPESRVPGQSGRQRGSEADTDNPQAV